MNNFALTFCENSIFLRAPAHMHTYYTHTEILEYITFDMNHFNLYKSFSLIFSLVPLRFGKTTVNANGTHLFQIYSLHTFN